VRPLNSGRLLIAAEREIMVTETSHSRKLGYADYVAFPDDGQRHEVIYGVHYVNPAPNLYHQAVSKRLLYQLYAKIELTGLGMLYQAPCDVQLSEHDIVQPDLLVVVSSRARILTLSKVQGVPDLVVEILSTATIDYDRKVKRDLYERSGVPEYWLVDPWRFSLEQLVLKAGKYQSQINHDEVHPQFVRGVVIDLREVW
jgi:Uma2 family endonuclease